jgi:hypothetical protein
MRTDVLRVRAERPNNGTWSDLRRVSPHSENRGSSQEKHRHRTIAVNEDSEDRVPSGGSRDESREELPEPERSRRRRWGGRTQRADRVGTGNGEGDVPWKGRCLAVPFEVRSHAGSARKQRESFEECSDTGTAVTASRRVVPTPLAIAHPPGLAAFAPPAFSCPPLPSSSPSPTTRFHVGINSLHFRTDVAEQLALHRNFADRQAAFSKGRGERAPTRRTASRTTG